jgi:hydroxymethylpyrimidine pyrophosphatase-like HAD family hydrolase
MSCKELLTLLQIAPNPTLYINKALKKLLRPLVTFLISNGITYPEVNEILKELFVEVAEKEFKLPGKNQTDSRINFLTGIHRKDVKRLKNKAVNEIEQEIPSLSALLISRWLGDSRYCDNQGQPKALSRSIKQKGDISFEGLVVSVNKDIRSRVILDEWLHMEIVYLNENDEVCLNQNAFIPEKGHEEKTWFFGENIADHIAAAVHNLNGNTPAYLERAVYYDQLSSQSAEELTELSEQLGMDALLKINNRALSLQNNDKKNKNNNYRIRLGLYFYQSLAKENISEEDK